jgi:hypothetical protein
MISTNFLGGLGNNLFQLATVYSIHKKFGYDLVIPSKVNRGSIGVYGQSTDLEFNRLFENNFSYSDSHKLTFYNHIDLNPNHTDFSYTPTPINDDTVYNGYFQSEKYFLGVDIKNLLKLNKKNINHIKEKYSNLFSKKNISLHYRLGGDRVESHMQIYHKNVSVDFYEKALNFIDDYNENDYNILVFTDNIKVCKEILEPVNKNFIYIDNQNDNVTDFTFMSMCDINILGNSTFSWWSAYLNTNKENLKVIVPFTEWFGPGYKNFTKKDLFLEEWIKI